MLQLFFQSLWLNKKETNIYNFLLAYGPQIASTIARKNNIKRSSIYALLKTLIEKKIIKEFKKNNVTYFRAISVDELVNLFEKKHKETQKITNNLSQIVSTLEKIQLQASWEYSLEWNITYYQWAQSVNKLIEETLNEPSKVQLCFWLNDFHASIDTKNWKHYTNKRVQNGIFVKSIQPNTPEAIAYAKRDNNELRKTKLVSKSKYPSVCELNIMWDMIALFTAKWNTPSWMKIYNPYFAKTLTSLFELAWDNLRDWEQK